jgi:N-acetyl-anhydromuramyl-L-alanine amidase AmpD
MTPRTTRSGESQEGALGRFAVAEWTPIRRRSYTPGGCEPAAIVFHRTDGTSSHGWLLGGGGRGADGEDRRVSAHFLVRRDGHVYQYLDTRDSSWAQGIRPPLGPKLSEHTPGWARRRILSGESPNDFVVSVENEAAGTKARPQPLTRAQLEANKAIAAWACAEHDIPPDRAHIVGHYQLNLQNRRHCPWGNAGALYPFDAVIAAVRGPRPAPGWRRVGVDAAHIRREPDRDSAPVGSLARGDVVECDAVRAGEPVDGEPWWLRLEDGRGWVHAGLLEATPAPPPLVGPGWHEARAELNVRPDPSTDLEPVGGLREGEPFLAELAVRGESVRGNPWWLRLAGGRGCVSAAHTRPALGEPRVSEGSALLAPPRAAAEQAERRLLRRPHGEYTPRDARRIVRLYWETAAPVGLDPLLAAAQMLHETAKLTSHWAARPRRNPAGIGVTGEPGAGVSFGDWEEAVRAHVGRLLAYALPAGGETDAQRALIREALARRPLPPRCRGVAPTVRGLAGTWAADREYARKLVRVAGAILAEPA